MTILDLELAHFGKFHHKTISFSSGLNVIYGKNEAGKSTIHAFIRCMLLGMKPAPGGKTNPNYEKYYPWDTSEPGYGGTLRMSVGGHTYRLERSFLKTAESFILTDETENEVLEPAEECLKTLLDGLNECSFDNTISINQLQSATEPELLAELSRFLVNTSQTKNVRLDMGMTKEHLEREADRLKDEFLQGAEEHLKQTEENLKRAGEEKNRLQDREYRTRKELDDLEVEIARTERESDEALLAYERERDSRRKQYEAAKNNWENAPDPETRRKNFLSPLFFLLALLCGAGAWYLWYRTGLEEQLYLYTAAGLCAGGVLCLLGLFLAISGNSRMKQRWKSEDALREKLRFQLRESTNRFENLKNEAPVSGEEATREMKRRLEELKEELAQCQGDLEKSRAAYEEFSADAVRIREQVSRNESVSRELESVELAMQTLNMVGLRVQETFGSRLCKEAAVILEQVTEGRYDRLMMNGGNIRIGTDERMHDLKDMSCGTVEQVYFSIRLAAASLLWQKQPLPFLFDDVFCRYDDERLATAMSLLKDCGHQVVIFSSNTREDQLLIS